MAAFFTPEFTDSLRPSIQSTVDKVLSDMIKKGCDKPVDLVESFSLPIPSTVRKPLHFILKIIGLLVNEKYLGDLRHSGSPYYGYGLPN